MIILKVEVEGNLKDICKQAGTISKILDVCVTFDFEGTTYNIVEIGKPKQGSFKVTSCEIHGADNCSTCKQLLTLR